MAMLQAPSTERSRPGPRARAGGGDRPRAGDDPDARRPLARRAAGAADPGRDHRRHAARRFLPRAAAQALGRLRDGPRHLLRGPARARPKATCRPPGSTACSGVHPWFMALLDDRAAQEVWGRDTSTLICSSLMPAGKAARGRRRLSAERPLALRELLRALRLGAARRAWWPPSGGGPPEGRVFLVPRTGLRDDRHLAGVRPAGDRKLGRHRR